MGNMLGVWILQSIEHTVDATYRTRELGEHYLISDSRHMFFFCFKILGHEDGEMYLVGVICYLEHGTDMHR